jgi:RND family efflux transporter MFP subunit
MEQVVELVRMVAVEVNVRRQAVCSVLFLTAFLMACDSKPGTNMSVAAPTAAEAAAPAKPVAPAEYVASGPLTVEDQVDVPAQRTGVIAKLQAEVGEHVRKGQVLAELDNRQLQDDVAAAEAKVNSTRFELEHWKAETKVLEADLTRDESMFKDGLITAQKLEHSRYAVVGDRYETQREEENLRNAQDTLASLKLELEKTHVMAPFDGVVARRYVQLGQKVAVGDRVYWVTALAPINVRFTVPQEFAGKLKPGDELSVVSPADPGRSHAARISLVSPVVDPASGTFEVQARLTASSPDLLPGMTVNIKLPKQ